MLKLFGKQPVEYPNARDFERKKYTRFEVVQRRECETSSEIPEPLVHTNSEYEHTQTLYQSVTPEIRPETPPEPASTPDEPNADSEISPSILRAALPIRFAQLDASRNLPSIHDVFNSDTD